MRNAVPTVSSIVASLGLLLLAGCASVGPPTVTRDEGAGAFKLTVPIANGRHLVWFDPETLVSGPYTDNGAIVYWSGDRFRVVYATLAGTRLVRK